MSSAERPELCAMAHTRRQVQKHPGCTCLQHGDGKYLPWRPPQPTSLDCPTHGTEEQP